jgi:hypothetical protein
VNIKPTRAFIRCFITRRFALLMLGLVVGVLAMPRFASAQQNIVEDDVEDVSDYCDFGYDCELESIAAILDTTSALELDTYSATYVNEDALDDGYDSFVCASVYQDDTEIAADCTGDDDGGGASELDGNIPINLSGGPYSFSVDTDSYLADVEDDFEACYDGDPDFCFYIVSTGVDVTLGDPEVTSTSPSYVFVGSSGTLVINGDSLINPFGGNPTSVQANYSGGGGSGMTVSGGSFTETQGSASYQVAKTATTGLCDIGVSYYLGDVLLVSVNEGNLTVGDPTPSITSINPPAWTAGTTIPITITGTGFGTSPTLTITGPGVTFQPGTLGDTLIQATVTIDASSPGGPATIQVQSNGYLGTGFAPAYSGQSSTATGTATITPYVPPVPVIVYGTNSSACSGANLDGTQQAKIAGQLIQLYGCATLPPPLYQTSQSWVVAGPVVGGYNASAATGTSFTVPNFSTTATQFYWFYPGSYSVQYSYCVSNGVCTTPASASVTFNISGPANLRVVVCPNGGAVANCPMNNENVQLDTVPKLEAGFFGNGIVSIAFSETETAPAGSGANNSVQWVQVLTSDAFQFLTTNQQYCGGGPVCTAVPNGWTGSPQLDNTYPYVVFPGAPTTTNDTPSYPLGLAVSEAEGERSFGAIMYLLWDPALPTGCTPANTISNNGVITSTASTCTQSIPIPLGSVTWNTKGCAINTLATATGDNGSTWHLACGTPSQNSPENPVFVASVANVTSYPTWTLTSHNGTVCQTHICTKQQ